MNRKACYDDRLISNAILDDLVSETCSFIYIHAGSPAGELDMFTKKKRCSCNDEARLFQLQQSSSQPYCSCCLRVLPSPRAAEVLRDWLQKISLLGGLARLTLMQADVLSPCCRAV